MTANNIVYEETTTLPCSGSEPLIRTAKPPDLAKWSNATETWDEASFSWQGSETFSIDSEMRVFRTPGRRLGSWTYSGADDPKGPWLQPGWQPGDFLVHKAKSHRN